MTERSGSSPAELQTLHFVGPVTAEILAAAGITVEDILHKRISYKRLVQEGINPGVAAKLRREHSLPWTIGGFDSDLDHRSQSVRGLRQGEREWIARSSDDWSSHDTAGTAPAQLDRDATGWCVELADEPASLESPLVLDGITQADADRLAEAGINTVRRLAVVDSATVATAIDRDPETVRRWQTHAETRRQQS